MPSIPWRIACKNIFSTRSGAANCREKNICSKQDICREICFIEQGPLRCFYHDGDREVSTWFMKEGDVIISVSSFL